MGLTTTDDPAVQPGRHPTTERVMNLVNLITPARPAATDGPAVPPGMVTLVGAGPGDPDLSE